MVINYKGRNFLAIRISALLSPLTRIEESAPNNIRRNPSTITGNCILAVFDTTGRKLFYYLIFDFIIFTYLY